MQEWKNRENRREKKVKMTYLALWISERKRNNDFFFVLINFINGEREGDDIEIKKQALINSLTDIQLEDSFVALIHAKR